MKVLMISTSFPKTGGDWKARFIANLVDALDAEDSCQLSLWAPPGEKPDSVTSACSKRDERMLDSLMERGGIAHLIRTNLPFALAYACAINFSLYRLFRRNKTDILHVHWLQNALLLRGNAPVVISVLGSDYGMLKWPFMVDILRLSLKKQPCILAPNASWMEPLLREKFGDIAEIRSVPFGIDPLWYSISRMQPAKTGTRNWLTVTRLTQKKIGTLFEWGEGLFNENDKLNLIGPMQEKNILIPTWASFHGPSGPEELSAKWFPSATALITLSVHDEGLPQVILEAMAAGLPIIASDITSHRDVIRHGFNGFLVSSKNDLIEAIETLSDETTNLKIGANAKKWAEEHFGTWKDCANRFTAIYRKLVENKYSETEENM